MGGSKGTEAMASGQLGRLFLVAFLVSACIGGQSGTEGQPDLPSASCSTTTRQPVGLDTETPFGTPRELLSALATPEVTSLRWFTSQSHGDTTLTLSVVGTPVTATYLMSNDRSCGGSSLELDGVSLQFQTADGTFNESFSGTVTISSSGSRFDAKGAVEQSVGSYDIAAVAQRYRNPYLQLQTALTPPRGHLSVEGASSPGSTATSSSIAEWPGAPDGGS